MTACYTDRAYLQVSLASGYTLPDIMHNSGVARKFLQGGGKSRRSSLSPLLHSLPFLCLPSLPLPSLHISFLPLPLNLFPPYLKSRTHKIQLGGLAIAVRPQLGSGTESQPKSNLCIIRSGDNSFNNFFLE